MNKLWFWLSIVSFPIFGSAITLIFEWQNRSILHGYKYHHPILQNVITAFGAFMSYPIYLIFLRGQPTSPYKTKLKFLITASIDPISMALQLSGLLLVVASIYQMIGAGALIFVLMFSYIIIQRVPNGMQVIGIIILFISIILIGVAEVIYSDREKNKSALIGFIMLFISTILSGCSSVLEEHFLKTIEIHPAEALGIESAGDLIVICCIILPIFCHVKCTTGDSCPTGTLEDLSLGLKQMFTTKIGGLQTGLLFLYTSIFNIASVNLNKDLGATSRAVLDCIRMLVIWIFCLGIKWEKFIWLELVAYIGIVSGVLVFNNIFAKCSRKKIDDKKENSYGAFEEIKKEEDHNKAV